MSCWGTIEERVTRLEMLAESIAKRFERHNDCTSIHHGGNAPETPFGASSSERAGPDEETTKDEVIGGEA